MNSKFCWRFIKSKYIIKKIFDILPTTKKLNIIQFNNNLKNILNIDIEDYKKNGIIEIEIPSDNINGQFISIKEEYSPFFHIYFDDNENETYKRYVYKSDKIHKIKIIIDHQVESLKGLFKNNDDLEKIEFTKCYRQTIIDISEMFFNCSKKIRSFFF